MAVTDDLTEAVARAICAGIGLRSWDDVPADRGDLRNRIRSGDGYDVNEPTRMDYRDGAQDAIRAAAPLILDMAAKEAQTCGFTDRESLRNSISYAIRQLKERFQ
jgi:hypothetical protein